MRICVVGSGYVGLVTGTCLADAGNQVVCVDADAEKVARLSLGECPLYEPGLEELMRSNLRAGRLRFTSDLAAGVQAADVAFVAVGTPPRGDGSADLTSVEAVAAGIGQAARDGTIVVMKSTVPIGTCDRVERIIASQRPAGETLPVISNPEFLKEGTAVEDFLRPDRVVIGAEVPHAADVIAELYRPFVLNNKPIIRMGRAAAEMTKYAANAYLATRISFINEVACVCERLGIDVDEVRRGIGGDARIGHHFLYPGVGYGGSCFPKDVQALAHTARAAGEPCDILEAVHRRNQRQPSRLVARVRERLGLDLHGRTLAVWGLAFKPKTDDVREAPALAIIRELLEAGAAIAVHDPKAMANARRELGDRVRYCEDAYGALDGADALLIVTEWNEFRSPDFEQMRIRLRQPLVFDGRNVFARDAMARNRIEYHSVGRPAVRP